MTILLCDLIFCVCFLMISETVHSYTKRVSELEQTVRRMVFQSYGVEKYYDSNIKSTDYVFRVNKYKRVNMQETTTGLIPHTDRNFMTIISALDEGLDIKARDGTWIAVSLSPLSFLVLAGETLLVSIFYLKYYPIGDTKRQIV